MLTLTVVFSQLCILLSPVFAQGKGTPTTVPTIQPQETITTTEPSTTQSTTTESTTTESTSADNAQLENDSLLDAQVETLLSK